MSQLLSISCFPKNIIFIKSSISTKSPIGIDLRIIFHYFQPVDLPSEIQAVFLENYRLCIHFIGVVFDDGDSEP